MGRLPLHGIFSAFGVGDPAFVGAKAGKGKATKESREENRSRGQGVGPPLGSVAVDIFEQDDYYIIKAPIAGVRLADLDIEISDNVLTIRGTRVSGDAQVSADQCYVQECFWGPFKRSITLPCTIDPRRVKATFNRECVLKIVVPKEDRVKIVRINAESGQ